MECRHAWIQNVSNLGVMHLSISCPTPGEGGRIQGIDKSWCQIPHYWGKIGCQIPTPIVGDLTTPQGWLSAYFMHATSNKIIASAILLLRNATTENRSVNWTTVNCPRGGDKKQCQIPTWGMGTPRGWGVGHEIDKCITVDEHLAHLQDSVIRSERLYSWRRLLCLTYLISIESWLTYSKLRVDQVFLFTQSSHSWTSLVPTNPGWD